MQIASAARRGAPMSRDTVARASEMAARSIANALLPKANPFFARYSSRSPPFPRDCAGAGGRRRNIMPSARKSSRGKMKRNASHTCHAGMEEDEIAGETAANTKKKERALERKRVGPRGHAGKGRLHRAAGLYLLESNGEFLREHVFSLCYFCQCLFKRQAYVQIHRKLAK